MQQVKEKFSNPDGTKYGSLQSCIRTNDLDLVGDGTHLTYFEMLGNFSFGGNDYQNSVELWDCILKDFNIPITHVTYHPSQDQHKKLWLDKGYSVKPDETCTWSDGNIGGFCCELFVGELEIGNLVNTLEHSTDVGFGYERFIQIIEGKNRVDETSIFNQNLHPIVRDHYRTLISLRENGIKPGYKSRDSICRKLLQRILFYETDFTNLIEIKNWIEAEKELQEKRVKRGLHVWWKYKNHSSEFWRSTVGLTKEDIEQLKRIKGDA